MPRFKNSSYILRMFEAIPVRPQRAVLRRMHIIARTSSTLANGATPRGVAVDEVAVVLLEKSPG